MTSTQPDPTHAIVALLAAAATEPPLPDEYRRQLLDGYDPVLVAIRFSDAFRHLAEHIYGAEKWKASLTSVAIDIAGSDA
jgi:hypothetical protein